jgi:hypothetical protein
MAMGWALVSPGKHADSLVAPAISMAEDTQLVAVCSRAKRGPMRLRPHTGRKPPTRRWRPLSRTPGWTWSLSLHPTSSMRRTL